MPWAGGLHGDGTRLFFCTGDDEATSVFIPGEFRVSLQRVSINTPDGAYVRVCIEVPNGSIAERIARVCTPCVCALRGTVGGRLTELIDVNWSRNWPFLALARRGEPRETDRTWADKGPRRSARAVRITKSGRERKKKIFIWLRTPGAAAAVTRCENNSVLFLFAASGGQARSRACVARAPLERG